MIAQLWRPEWMNSPFGIVCTIVPTVLFVGSGVEYLIFIVRVRTKPLILSTATGRSAYVDEPRAEEINTLVSEAGSHGISKSLVWIYLRAILVPKGFYERISERVELGHVSQIRRTSFTCDVLGFRVSKEKNRPSISIMEQVAIETQRSGIVIPLTLEARGNLGGGLRVLDDSGKPVSTVSSYDLAIFQLAVIRHLIRTSPTLSLRSYIRDVEPLVSFALRRRVAPTDLERTSMLDALRGFVAGAEQESVIMRLMTILVDYNPICVSLNSPRLDKMVWPETVRFTVEKRKAADLNDLSSNADDDGDNALRWLDGLRTLLGVPINRVYSPILEGDRTRSFHLEVCGPPGTYVARQAFIVTPPQAVNDVQLDAYVAPRNGQRRARAMVTAIRRKDEGQSVRVFFAVKFFERAPGSFSVSTIASLILTFVASVLFVSSLNLVDIPQSIAGILLSLPAASVALSGLDSRREFRQPSLLSLGLNALLLFTVALALFVLLVPQSPEAEQALWRTVLVAASISLVVSASTWITRVRAERLIRAGVDESVELSGSSPTVV